MAVFSIRVSDEQLETMMDYLKDTKGLIIDIRNNFGGYVELASRIASYFTMEDYKFGDNNVKVGPGPDDFAKSEMYIKASGSPLTYTKPVIILHDRISFSSGALFPIMMSVHDNVTTMGTTTGGGTGEIIEGFLSNGWEYILSTSNLLDINGNPTDNGTPPDIEVATNPDDTDRDAVIERAILELQSQF